MVLLNRLEPLVLIQNKIRSTWNFDVTLGIEFIFNLLLFLGIYSICKDSNFSSECPPKELRKMLRVAGRRLSVSPWRSTWTPTSATAAFKYPVGGATDHQEDSRSTIFFLRFSSNTHPQFHFPARGLSLYPISFLFVI